MSFSASTNSSMVCGLFAMAIRAPSSVRHGDPCAFLRPFFVTSGLSQSAQHHPAVFQTTLSFSPTGSLGPTLFVPLSVKKQRTQRWQYGHGSVGGRRRVPNDTPVIIEPVHPGKILKADIIRTEIACPYRNSLLIEIPEEPVTSSYFNAIVWRKL